MESERVNIEQCSFFSPLGYQAGSCGYCKAPDTSASFYASSKSLSTAHYQEMMDHSWRRSGNVLYFPDNSRSCCPHYTIRLPVSQFQPRRDQRQAVNRWNRFVLGDNYEQEKSRVYPKSREQKRHQNNTFDLVGSLHEAEKEYIRPGLNPAHNFKVSLEPDTFSEEKFKLFEQYQRLVHREEAEEISRSGFKRFLCSSPLRRSQEQLDNDTVQQLGSFHQTYRLDGKLIALAVLDLLPHAVSAVYFIYDVEYERFSFGKLSAMREAAMALEGGYEFYYMGFYIHSCPKMRYKADFRPQQVLDLSTYKWNTLDDELRALMDKTKFVMLSQERRKIAAQDGNNDHISSEESTKTTSSTAKQESIDEALSSGQSVLTLNVPGVMKLEELQDRFDIGNSMLSLSRHGIVRLHDLTVFDGGNFDDPHQLEGIIAELAGVLRPPVAKEMIVVLG